MAMTVFESSVKTLKANRKPVHRYLSDLRNFESLIPEGRVRNLEIEGDSCRFTIDGVGEMRVRKVPGNDEGSVRFESENSKPFRFDLSIELVEAAGSNTEMKLVLSAELNMMMKMMARKPLRDGVEMVASILTEELNQKELG